MDILSDEVITTVTTIFFCLPSQQVSALKGKNLLLEANSFLEERTPYRRVTLSRGANRNSFVSHSKPDGKHKGWQVEGVQ